MKVSPFHEVAKNADARIKDGWDVYQQWNCAHCGVKQTMPTKNMFHHKGRCEECGKITDILKDGCNFMATFAISDQSISSAPKRS